MRCSTASIASISALVGGTAPVRVHVTADAAAATGLATPPVAGSDPTAVAADALTSLRYLVLGYDIDEADARPLLAALNAARQDLLPDDPTVLEGELAAFQIFADLCALSRNRRGPLFLNPLIRALLNRRPIRTFQSNILGRIQT